MREEEKSDLLRQLQNEFDQATRDHLRIQRELDRIVMQAPSGLPMPDGQQRIINAGKRARYAFKQYERALGSLLAFVNDGVAPEPADLNQQDSSPKKEDV